MSIIVETVKTTLSYLQEVIPDVVCRRSYFSVADVEELKAAGKPVILIVPIERTGTMLRAGGTVNNEITIDICINAKLKQIDTDNENDLTAEIDSYIELAEKIFAYFHKVERAADGLQVVFLNPKHLVVNDIEQLQDFNCFLSVIRVQAKVFARSD